jgi:Fe-S cluster assembly protein SufD
MATVMQEKESTLEQFTRFAERAAGNGQAWLHPMRRAAIARFAELGFPTTRHEDWKFTNVASIAQTAFALAPEGVGQPARRDLDPFLFPGLESNLLVFVNGRYAPQFSSLELPIGVLVSSLAHACAAHRDLAEQHLGRYVDVQGDAFAALNTAFMEDGAFVFIPKGTILDAPVHLLYVSTAAPAPVMTHPRNLIVMGEDSQATVVEDYVSLDEGVSFSNGVTEAVVGQNGILSHCLVERESVRAFNVSTLRIEQGRSSNVASHSVLLGGALVRNNVHPVLSGEGAECLVNGLFLAAGRQHMDNYMRVEHQSPHCASRQFYNGILDGSSHGVFQGRIVVHKEAQKTDAKQTNRNLLLSEDAQIDTKPQLEIYADDVKCTHGATIGQVNEEAIFYLRSRGIGKEAARALLLLGFADECLDRMKAEPIRRHLAGLVRRRLPYQAAEKGPSAALARSRGAVTYV